MTTTKTTHTPGPWRLTASGQTIRIDGDINGEYYYGVAMVSPFDDDHIGIPSALDRANARLIAAAPELLAALSRIVAWVDAGCDPSEPSINAARAAIAKATP